MIDPVTAIAGATAAFNAIKSGFSVGRDIESMAGDLGRWMNCISDLKKSEEMNKKPPLFKKLFQAGSVEEEAMQIFMAKKKAEDMRDQLRQIIVATRGPSAWDELIKTEGDIRKKRQQMIYAQEERRRQLIEIVAVIGLVLVIGANDVVNPSATEQPGSPIYGMPIIEVHKAKTVVVLKRSMSSGFAGVQNPLFFKENTRMLFGDAKESISKLVAEFKE